MAERTRVLIVEREPLFRRGVATALEAAPFEVVGHAGTLGDGLRLALSLRPDVVLVGTSLPDAPGFAALDELTRRAPGLPAIVVGETAWDDDLVAALRGGAAAHLGKDAGEETLRETIRRVAHGEQVIQQQLLERPQVSGRVVERAGAFGRARPLPRRPPLTARELQVLRGISAGKTNGEIGDELGISAQTVKNHVTAILRKLGVSDRTQAVVLGLRQGWLAMEGIVPPPAAPPGEGE